MVSPNERKKYRIKNIAPKDLLEPNGIFDLECIRAQRNAITGSADIEMTLELSTLEYAVIMYGLNISESNATIEEAKE